MLVSRYTYAVVYVLSVAAFIAAVEPSVVEDYFRVGTAAAMVVILLWMVQSALIYQRRYHALPPEKRGRMMAPKLAWSMGASSILSFALNARAMFDLVGSELKWYGAPAILVVLALSAAWLGPLIRHERKMQQREKAIRT